MCAKQVAVITGVTLCNSFNQSLPPPPFFFPSLEGKKTKMQFVMLLREPATP